MYNIKLMVFSLLLSSSIFAQSSSIVVNYHCDGHAMQGLDPNTNKVILKRQERIFVRAGEIIERSVYDQLRQFKFSLYIVVDDTGKIEDTYNGITHVATGTMVLADLFAAKYPDRMIGSVIFGKQKNQQSNSQKNGISIFADFQCSLQFLK